MKILSRENHRQGGKHVLIPCYLYEIVANKSYDGNNILEEAVAKIIEIDPYYNNNIEKLAEILGLKNNNDIDYRALLKLVLNKINNPTTQELREEIVQYQIYQERRSGEVLNIVTQDVDRFIESSGGNKSKNEILFERDGKNFKAKVVYPPISSGISIPTLDQVFKAVAMHNKNNDFKISENLDLEIPKHKEEIYLHCQIVLDENRKFNITNGFNAASSLQLESILNNHYGDLLKNLRAENHIDEKQENNYKQNYGDLRDVVAYNLQRFAKENKCQYLYNAYEKYFAYLVQKNEYTMHISLSKPEFIKDCAEQMGFTINQARLLFINDNGDNLKSYLAKLLFHKDVTLNRFAKKPEFLNLLFMLHNDRNIALHGGGIEKNNKPMDIKELNILKELLESISNINTKEGKETRSHNGMILLEQEVPRKVLNRLSDDNIEALAEAFRALEVCKDNQDLSLDVFGDITHGLYKVCESVMRQYIQIHKASIREMDIEKTRKVEWLSKVGEHHIKKAKQGENATLGAYVVIYLSINQDEDLLYVKQLLELRAHANPTIEDIKKTSVDELKKLHENIINFIVKIIYHI
ncbi:hypothetical protein [Campylobacter sp. CNRCH_2016_0050h]|uniref:hypothetical protein n=1 Tax=Campylobacter sp. CNRCH_2016_0050h TaxID=2911608 RepID=UPI0021E6CFBA|nr:hypothetical protein [Campylobacter sp. CNRCH_2016_0050h]MCV3457591.1 hypothetical protein [Campylobacter sp. CNRCH_2016_0050h]